MSNEAQKAPVAAISETDIVAGINPHVDKLLAKQGLPAGKARWTKKDHISLILRIAVDCGMEKENVAHFGQFLSTAGLGGNQSQFTQSKFLKGKIARETLSEALAVYDVE